MKICTACHQKKKISAFREKCGAETIEYFMCKACRDVGENMSRAAIGDGSNVIAEQANKLGLNVK